MFDLDALLAAGFEKALTTEEWEALQQELPERYARSFGSEMAKRPGANVTVDYVLQRGNVRLVTEQNTQDQSPFGVRTTVHYPEIVIVENIDDGRRVACDASNAELILLLADEITKPVEPQGNPRRGPRLME